MLNAIRAKEVTNFSVICLIQNILIKSDLRHPTLESPRIEMPPCKDGLREIYSVLANSTISLSTIRTATEEGSNIHLANSSCNDRSCSPFFIAQGLLK